MHNIGLVFVKMAQYSEACTSFEYIMQEEANFKTGLDLVTAYYALGDKEKMKKGFLRLLECQLDIDDDEKYTASSVSYNNFSCNICVCVCVCVFESFWKICQSMTP